MLGVLTKPGDPARIAAQSGNFPEQFVYIAVDHCILDPPAYLPMINFIAQQDIAAEVAIEYIALVCSHYLLDDQALTDLFNQVIARDSSRIYNEGMWGRAGSPPLRLPLPVLVVPASAAVCRS